VIPLRGKGNMINTYIIIYNGATTEIRADKFDVTEDKYIFYRAGRVIAVFTAANVIGFREQGR